jgi:hypothetical protein
MPQYSDLPKGHGPGRTVKGLPYAVQNISVQLSVTVENLLKSLRASIWTVLVPGITVLVLITVLMTVAWRIQKMMRPPTAADLHRQALLLLLKQEQGPQHPESTKQQYQQVLELLTKALQQDRKYLPARLSLIAMYLYRLSDGHAAVRELHELLDEHGIIATLQTQGLLLDAQAIISGQGHMVQGALQEDQYLRTIQPPIKSERCTSLRKDGANDTSIKCKTQ